MKRLLMTGIVVALGLISFAWASAQEDDSDAVDPASIETDVYVTTQFNVNLREGPGTSWPVMETLPPGLTLPVIGRTSDTDWAQVVRDDEMGWLSTRYVVWSGNIITLPVDGIDPRPYVRRVGVGAFTVRETPYYEGQVTPAHEVGVLPQDTEVEIVGRLGYSHDGLFNVQIRYNGHLYWVGAWNLRLTDGRYRSLLDNAYRAAYTRLARQFDDDISDGLRRLSSIENIWRALQRGEEVRCDRELALLPERRVSDSDLNARPQFQPVATTLDTAIGHTNTALAMFHDACNREGPYITQQEVRVALEEVDGARQNFNLARSLLVSLQRRDPLLGDLR